MWCLIWLASNSTYFHKSYTTEFHLCRCIGRCIWKQLCHSEVRLYCICLFIKAMLRQNYTEQLLVRSPLRNLRQWRRCLTEISHKSASQRVFWKSCFVYWCSLYYLVPKSSNFEFVSNFEQNYYLMTMIQISSRLTRIAAPLMPYRMHKWIVSSTLTIDLWDDSENNLKKENRR